MEVCEMGVPGIYKIIWNSFKITKRWRGGIISYNDLKINNLYRIHLTEKAYYIGIFVRFKGETAEFRILKCNVEEDLYFLDPVYFNHDKVFMCIVDFDEQDATYRAAFEKRAVNQIVGNIIGHAGDYY